MDLHLLPPLNATLNSVATILLIGGYVAIKRGRYRAHGWMMSMALVVSTLFLIGYVTHKVMRGDIITQTAFPNLPGWIRWMYRIILFPHLILAMGMVPMIIIVFLRAYRRDWPRHRRLAVWTLPIWIYVSVTGVIIYWMLYHLFPIMGRS